MSRSKTVVTLLPTAVHIAERPMQDSQLRHEI